MKLNFRHFFAGIAMAIFSMASLGSVASAGTILAPQLEFNVSYIEPFPDIVQIEQSITQELDEDRATVKAPDVGKLALVHLPGNLRSRIEHVHSSSCDHAVHFSKLSFENQKAGNPANPKLDARL